MFDIFEFYAEMKAEDAAKLAKTIKTNETKDADYSPEPDEIKPVKKEETVNPSIGENTALEVEKNEGE